MNKELEAQKQPQYSEQHQQPYPHYYPLPPPREDKKRLTILIVIIVTIVIVVPVILSFLLYWIVTDLPPDQPPSVPAGAWARTYVLDPTSVIVDFGSIRPEPRPVDLEIVLTRNATYEGRYAIATNHDSRLVFSSGFHVGTLNYEDLADNGRVDAGDRIRMTGLAPMSDHVLRMIWAPTGDLIDSTSFATPG